MQATQRKPQPSRRIRATLAIFGVAATACCAAYAQGGYPARPVSLVVGFAAGGSTDKLARLLAKEMQEALGQQVVVENRPGAAGNIAAQYVAQAAPDGYTAALIPIPQVSMYYLDPERGGDFSREAATVVAQHDYGALAIAVAAGSPHQTLADVVAAAKEKPGSLTSASSSVLGTGHLSLLRLEKVAGIDLNWTAMEQQGTALASLLTHIPYGRIGMPEDIGKVVTFIASDDADYIHGQTIFVDGGMTLYPEFADGG